VKRTLITVVFYAITLPFVGLGILAALVRGGVLLGIEIVNVVAAYVGGEDE